MPCIKVYSVVFTTHYKLYCDGLSFDPWYYHWELYIQFSMLFMLAVASKKNMTF